MYSTLRLVSTAAVSQTEMPRPDFESLSVVKNCHFIMPLCASSATTLPRKLYGSGTDSSPDATPTTTISASAMYTGELHRCALALVSTGVDHLTMPSARVIACTEPLLSETKTRS